MVDTNKSSSVEQQSAEVYIASMVEGWLVEADSNYGNRIHEKT